MIRIVTDNASDITLAQAKEMGVELISLVTSFEDGAFPLDTNEDYDRLYARLAQCKSLPFTSRPTPDAYMQIYRAAREAGDDVIVLTLSSGLSGTYESACVAKVMQDYDRITVIDTEQAVMAQRLLVEHAVALRDKGCTANVIVREVLDLRDCVTVLGVIGSLVNLRRGGRIPPALGIIGDALGIKPVITVKDKLIVDVGKVRGIRSGIAMTHKMLDLDGVDPDYPVIFGYTSNCALGESYMQDTVQRYGIQNARLCQVGGIIGTHLGPESIGVAYVRRKRG